MAPIVKDWRVVFMQAHERLFDLIADEPQRSFGYPLCDAGWRDILERLCIKIETALQENDAFEFVRIKQKFGVLGPDGDGEVLNDTRAKISRRSISRSPARACTCEICGAEGRRYDNRGWLATACAEHAVGYPELVGPGFENIRKLRRVAGKPGMYYVRYGPGGRHLDRGVPKFDRTGAIAMARFRCHVCGEEGAVLCRAGRKCCGATRSKSSSPSAPGIAGRRPRLSRRRGIGQGR